MPTSRFAEEVAQRARRFSHLAVLRFLLALGYFSYEVGYEAVVKLGSPSAIKWTVSILFFLASAYILKERGEVRIRNAAFVILGLDMLMVVTAVFLSTTGEVALSLLMFYFLITEASLLHGAREVLVVSTISLAFYASWIDSESAEQFRFSYESFMFLLVVGGALAYYFSGRRNRSENRIASLARSSVGQSEPEFLRTMEESLQELKQSFDSAIAILAVWDRDIDYYAMAVFPPTREAGAPPPSGLDARQEWSCFRGSRLELCENDVSLVDDEGRAIQRDFDLHRTVVQKFEAYNAVGAGLYDGDRPIGRLLVLNCLSEVRSPFLKKLQDIAPVFREPARHLLAMKRTEHDAYERERGRIAHDLHDGPLQSMISFEMRLQIIRKLYERNSPKVADELEAVQQFSRVVVSEVRGFVIRMRPLESNDASFVSSAKRLVDNFQKESGVSVTFVTSDNGDVTLPGKARTETLQIIREALYNILKHAQATHVLFALERKGESLQISVDDNGKGFRFGGRFSLDELDAVRLGPRSIKQRVRALGGGLTLKSTPGKGANLQVLIPITE